MSDQPDQRAQRLQQCASDLQSTSAQLSDMRANPDGCVHLAILLLCDLRTVLADKEYQQACRFMALATRAICSEAIALEQMAQQDQVRTVTETVEDCASGTDSPPTAH
jgi:hypothetical protein